MIDMLALIGEAWKVSLGLLVLLLVAIGVIMWRSGK